jgi:O-antigen/teichoic acid export membrane protein
LAPWTLVVFLTVPLANTLLVLNRQGINMVFQSLLLASRVLAIFVGSRRGSATESVAAFAVISFIGVGLFLVFLMHSNKVKFRSWARSLLVEFLISLPVAALAYFALTPVLASSNPTARVLALAAAGLVGFGLTAWRTKLIWKDAVNWGGVRNRLRRTG